MLPLCLPHPVTALVTDRPDDLAVVDAAMRLAAPRKAPVLLVAVLPAPSQIPDRAHVDAQAARMFLAWVLPRLRAAEVGYIPVAHRVPAESGGQPRLRAVCWPWPHATIHRWWWPPAGDRPVWTRTA
ncbi:hypothetical protein ABZ281_12190 [Streptomyces sp. NPDC006265]|uniref:hypothetical protein n=1 Tax=Streptomyces sp. NPDC006265 TaxID=3156740 RepID=UPI0033A5F32C